MGFPSKERIKKALKRLEKVEGTLAPPSNPTPLEKFRYDIQQKFVVYKHDERISQREMAEILGIDESKVSKILHNRLKEFSTDRLINLYGKLNPKVQLKVS
jgi:predicted XRE-type DNA-binding protein